MTKRTNEKIQEESCIQHLYHFLHIHRNMWARPLGPTFSLSIFKGVGLDSSNFFSLISLSRGLAWKTREGGGLLRLGDREAILRARGDLDLERENLWRSGLLLSRLASAIALECRFYRGC